MLHNVCVVKNYKFYFLKAQNVNGISNIGGKNMFVLIINYKNYEKK